MPKAAVVSCKTHSLAFLLVWSFTFYVHTCHRHKRNANANVIQIPRSKVTGFAGFAQQSPANINSAYSSTCIGAIQLTQQQQADYQGVINTRRMIKMLAANVGGGYLIAVQRFQTRLAMNCCTYYNGKYLHRNGGAKHQLIRIMYIYIYIQLSTFYLILQILHYNMVLHLNTILQLIYIYIYRYIYI